MFSPKRVRTVSRRSYPDLKTWRTAHDLGQRDAAAKLGISQTVYSRLERRRQSVKGELAKHLMAETGVPLEVLAGVSR